MGRTEETLSQSLMALAKRMGAPAFGVVSVDEADEMPPVKVDLKSVNRYTQPLRSAMPRARSAVVFGALSTDDVDEIEVERSDGDLEYPGFMMLRVIARDIMRAIRMAGYDAALAPYLASNKRVARLAGIGNYGKSSLIISPRYGPWLRFGIVLTDAELRPSRPFEKDLCGRCQRCVKACPAGAIRPYVLDENSCLVALTRAKNPSPKVRALLNKYSPELTPQSRVMCTECQKVCRYTSVERRGNSISLGAAGRSKR